jgi:phage tail-like protein
VDGVLLAGFGELSGLQAQTEVFEYKEGGLNSYTHKLPGRTTYSNVTLKWGATNSSDLWKWYHDLLTSTKTKDQKKRVSIVHYDEEHQEVRRWNLSGVFPVKWVGPSFNSATSAVAIDSLELAYAEFEFVGR